MLENIETSKGTIVIHNEKVFQYGLKKIDLEISKKNLLDFREILLRHNIKFGLIYGTLLGAIREHNFIKHDEDTDVYILGEEREAFLESLADFEKEGFIVGRYDEDALLSLVREDEYIDVYMFEKARFGNRIRRGQVIKEKYLSDTIEYNFLGKSFNVAKKYEEFLVYLYGEDWKIPKEDTPADTPIIRKRLAKYIKSSFPKLYHYLVNLRDFSHRFNTF